jgi:hypothetical protein
MSFLYIETLLLSLRDANLCWLTDKADFLT